MRKNFRVLVDAQSRRPLTKEQRVELCKKLGLDVRSERKATEEITRGYLRSIGELGVWGKEPLSFQRRASVVEYHRIAKKLLDLCAFFAEERRRTVSDKNRPQK